MEVHLIPDWKRVMARAYTVWVAVVGTLGEILMFAAANMESIQVHVPEKYKFAFRMLIGIAIIVVRPIQQRSLKKVPEDGSATPIERKEAQ